MGWPTCPRPRNPEEGTVVAFPRSDVGAGWLSAQCPRCRCPEEPEQRLRGSDRTASRGAALRRGLVVAQVALDRAVDRRRIAVLASLLQLRASIPLRAGTCDGALSPLPARMGRRRAANVCGPRAERVARAGRRGAGVSRFSRSAGTAAARDHSRGTCDGPESVVSPTAARDPRVSESAARSANAAGCHEGDGPTAPRVVIVDERSPASMDDAVRSAAECICSTARDVAKPGPSAIWLQVSSFAGR